MLASAAPTMADVRVDGDLEDRLEHVEDHYQDRSIDVYEDYLCGCAESVPSASSSISTRSFRAESSTRAIVLANREGSGVSHSGPLLYTQGLRTPTEELLPPEAHLLRVRGRQRGPRPQYNRCAGRCLTFRWLGSTVPHLPRCQH